MSITEEGIINRIAHWERSIDGVRNSYGAFQNPSNVTTAVAPCVLHYPPRFETGGNPKANFNRWENKIYVRSVLLVAPRVSRGANLSYLENEAMPFLQKWRLKFQGADVINDLRSVTSGGVRAFLVDGNYGVGGQLLTINNVPWIGCIFNFEFTEIV